MDSVNSSNWIKINSSNNYKVTWCYSKNVKYTENNQHYLSSCKQVIVNLLKLFNKV